MTRWRDIQKVIRHKENMRRQQPQNRSRSRDSHRRGDEDRRRRSQGSDDRRHRSQDGDDRRRHQSRSDGGRRGRDRDRPGDADQGYQKGRGAPHYGSQAGRGASKQGSSKGSKNPNGPRVAPWDDPSQQWRKDKNQPWTRAAWESSTPKFDPSAFTEPQWKAFHEMRDAEAAFDRTGRDEKDIAKFTERERLLWHVYRTAKEKSERVDAQAEAEKKKRSTAQPPAKGGSTATPSTKGNSAARAAPKGSFGGANPAPTPPLSSHSTFPVTGPSGTATRGMLWYSGQPGSTSSQSDGGKGFGPTPSSARGSTPPPRSLSTYIRQQETIDSQQRLLTPGQPVAETIDSPQRLLTPGQPVAETIDCQRRLLTPGQPVLTGLAPELLGESAPGAPEPGLESPRTAARRAKVVASLARHQATTPSDEYSPAPRMSGDDLVDLARKVYQLDSDPMNRSTLIHDLQERQAIMSQAPQALLQVKRLISGLLHEVCSVSDGDPRSTVPGTSVNRSVKYSLTLEYGARTDEHNQAKRNGVYRWKGGGDCTFDGTLPHGRTDFSDRKHGSNGAWTKKEFSALDNGRGPDENDLTNVSWCTDVITDCDFYECLTYEWTHRSVGAALRPPGPQCSAKSQASAQEAAADVAEAQVAMSMTAAWGKEYQECLRAYRPDLITASFQFGDPLLERVFGELVAPLLLNGVGLKFLGRSNTTRMISNHGPANTTTAAYYFFPPSVQCEKPTRSITPVSQVLSTILDMAMSTHPAAAPGFFVPLKDHTTPAPGLPGSAQQQASVLAANTASHSDEVVVNPASSTTAVNEVVVNPVSSTTAGIAQAAGSSGSHPPQVNSMEASTFPVEEVVNVTSPPTDAIANPVFAPMESAGGADPAAVPPEKLVVKNTTVASSTDSARVPEGNPPATRAASSEEDDDPMMGGQASRRPRAGTSPEFPSKRPRNLSVPSVDAECAVVRQPGQTRTCEGGDILMPEATLSSTYLPSTEYAYCSLSTFCGRLGDRYKELNTATVLLTPDGLVVTIPVHQPLEQEILATGGASVTTTPEGKFTLQFGPSRVRSSYGSAVSKENSEGHGEGGNGEGVGANDKWLSSAPRGNQIGQEYGVIKPHYLIKNSGSFSLIWRLASCLHEAVCQKKWRDGLNQGL